MYDFHCNVKIIPVVTDPLVHVTMLTSCVGFQTRAPQLRTPLRLSHWDVYDVGQTADVVSFVIPFDPAVREEFAHFFDHVKIVARVICGDTEEFSFDPEFFENIEDSFHNSFIHSYYQAQARASLAHIINLAVQKFLKTIVKDAGDSADLSYDDDAIRRIYHHLKTLSDVDGFDPASFGIILDKERSIVRSIHSPRWEQFQQMFKLYSMETLMIPLGITVRWNSAFRMLLYTVYLHRPIHQYVDDRIAKTNPKWKWEEMQLTNAKWEQTKVLVMFLLPFNRYTARFECNNSSPEIDYVFFAYNTMYDHVDDEKSKLESRIGIGALPCAKYTVKAIGEMELKKYYKKTSFPTVYGDPMILNPRTKLIIFEQESWEDTNAEEYSNACRRRVFNSMTNLNPISPPAQRVVLVAINVRRHITEYGQFSIVHLSDTDDFTSRSLTIPISHLYSVGGAIIIVNTRMCER